MIIENKPKESYCPDDEDENLVFHYQRREGLKNTAEKAQNNCNGSEPNSPRGFFKVLVQTKASRSILLILIMTFTITLITTYFVPNENQFIGSEAISNTRLAIKSETPLPVLR